MQLAEVLNVLHDLPRSDKFRAVQFLTADLAQAEESALWPDAEYAVWSPHDATEAATILTQFLREQTAKP